MKKILTLSTTLLALCLALPAAGEGTGRDPGGYGGMSNDSPTSGNMPRAGEPATGAQPGTTSSSSRKVSRKDRNFLEDVIEANMAEVSMGQIAKQQAQNPMVRDYANMMINDHTPARQQLMDMARSMGVTPPTELDFMHRRSEKKLRNAEAAEVDEIYIKSQVKDHKKLMEMLEDQLQDGESEELKSFASGMLPKVREHLVMAQRLEEQIKQKQ